MTLKISDKDQLLNAFLLPLSKVTDSIVLDVDGPNVKALISTQDNTVIVSASFNEPNNTSVNKLNIPDVKKLCRILQCIDEQTVELKLESNNISYSSASVRFKYHLYDEGIISMPKLNLAKLDQLDFNGEFTLKQSVILSLIKGSTIATDSNKIYVSFKDNTIYGELTDKARANVDSYGLKISDDYVGSPTKESVPLNFEIFRIISSIKFDTIYGKFASSTGVFVFNMKTGSTDMKFIVSALAN